MRFFLNNKEERDAFFAPATSFSCRLTAYITISFALTWKAICKELPFVSSPSTTTTKINQNHTSAPLPNPNNPAREQDQPAPCVCVSSPPTAKIPRRTLCILKPCCAAKEHSPSPPVSKKKKKSLW